MIAFMIFFRFALLAAIAVALLSMPGTLMAPAAEVDRVEARFEIFGFAGLHVLTNRTTIEEWGDRYAIAMDLDTTRYETFSDLFEYCRRVASAVGMICIRIFGCRNASAREYALNLGAALQLTNILRDVKGDLDRGRVYLPLEDLRAHGCAVVRKAIGDRANSRCALCD